MIGLTSTFELLIRGFGLTVSGPLAGMGRQRLATSLDCACSAGPVVSLTLVNRNLSTPYTSHNVDIGRCKPWDFLLYPDYLGRT